MEKLKGLSILVLTWFSFGAIVVLTPSLVYEVSQSSSSKVVEVEVVHSSFGYEEVGFSGDDEDCYMEVEVNILSNNKIIVIKDAKPGDIPTCSSKKKFADIYHIGDFALVFLSKDGKYYLSSGSYLEAVTPGILSIIWFIFLYSYIKRHSKKEAQVSPNKQINQD